MCWTAESSSVARLPWVTMTIPSISGQKVERTGNIAAKDLEKIAVGRQQAAGFKSDGCRRHFDGSGRQPAVELKQRRGDRARRTPWEAFSPSWQSRGRPPVAEQSNTTRAAPH